MLILLLAFVVIGLGILNKVAPTVDMSEYKQEIVGQLGELIQRKISIDGALRLKVSLKPILTTSGLTVENLKWCKTPNFLKSEQFEFGLDVLDLLLGKITIDHLVLKEAVVNLEETKDGRNNWTFGTDKQTATKEGPKKRIRLDYVSLDRLNLNYLGPKQDKKFRVSRGVLKRSLRGRYRIELDSRLGKERLLVNLLSNRWFDATDFRPLEIEAEAQYGVNRLVSKLNIQQLTPRLKLDVKLDSDMLDIDSLLKPFPKSKKNKPAKENLLDALSAWLEKTELVDMDVHIRQLRYGRYDLAGVVVKNRLIHDKSWNKDIYSINSTAKIKSITNRRDKKQALFSRQAGSQKGSLDFALKSKALTADKLVSNAGIKLTVQNLSGNKPYPYTINRLDVRIDDQQKANFKGDARYRDTQISFAGKSAKAFLNTLHKEKRLQLYSRLKTGKSTADVELGVKDIDKKIKNVQLHIDGDYLANWSTVLGVKLPLIEKYTMQGKMDFRADGIKSKSFRIKTPLSNLKGRFFYHYGKPATLNMQLHDSHLVITDLRREPRAVVTVPTKKRAETDNEEDEKPAKAEMIIPKTDLMSLLSPTIKMNFDVRSSSVEFKRFTVRGLDLKTRWENKVFATQIVAGKLANGDLSSDIYLTIVDNEAAGKIELHVKQLDYGKLLEEMNVGDKMKGTADVNINLVGFGRNLKEFLTRSDGIAEFVGEKGVLASKYIKLWGEDIVQQILPFNWFDSEETQLNCVVGRFDLTDGRLSSDSLLIDTKGMTIAGTGAIDLDTEELAFELMPDPKNVSLVSLATPVKIRGTLANPRIEPHTLGTAWTIGSLLVGLANPAILIARFAKLGSLGENPCLAAIGKKKGEEEETSILKMFKDTVKFIQRPLDKMPDLE